MPMSLPKAADVTCAIMKPELNPPSSTRKAGSSLYAAMVMKSTKFNVLKIGQKYNMKLYFRYFNVYLYKTRLCFHKYQCRIRKKLFIAK